MNVRISELAARDARAAADIERAIDGAVRGVEVAGVDPKARAVAEHIMAAVRTSVGEAP